MVELWTPLFSGLVGASIWEAPYHVRIVWVAILALKDRTGFLSYSVPGLARVANVTREECEDALRRFEAPDPDSKCQEHQGKKIVKVEGGWKVLGHERNQAKMHEVSEELRRMKNAARQAKWREKNKGSNRPLRSHKPTSFPGQAIIERAERNGASSEELDRLHVKLLEEHESNKKR